MHENLFLEVSKTNPHFGQTLIVVKGFRVQFSQTGLWATFEASKSWFFMQKVVRKKQILTVEVVLVLETRLAFEWKDIF